MNQKISLAWQTPSERARECLSRQGSARRRLAEGAGRTETGRKGEGRRVLLSPPGRAARALGSGNWFAWPPAWPPIFPEKGQSGAREGTRGHRLRPLTDRTATPCIYRSSGAQGGT